MSSKQKRRRSHELNKQNTRLSPVSVTDIPVHTVAKDNDDEFNYISDDEDGVQRITALVANETVEVPGLVVKTIKLANGMVSANQYLQMNEWAYNASEFAGVVIDEEIGKQMEYRDLIKKTRTLITLDKVSSQRTWQTNAGHTRYYWY